MSKVETGNLDINQYLEQLKKFIQIDQTILKFLTQIQLQKGVFFIQNWLQVFQNELQEIQTQIEQNK